VTAWSPDAIGHASLVRNAGKDVVMDAVREELAKL